MTGEGSKTETGLPFEDLLAQLERSGFQICPDHYVRLRMVLHRFSGQCGPSDLKTLLCPLFATNADSQERFYRAFDSCYPFLLNAEHSSPRVDGQQIGGPGQGVTSQSSRRWRYLLAGALAVVIALLSWRIIVKSNRPQQAPAGVAPDSLNRPVLASKEDGGNTGGASPAPASQSGWLDWYGAHRISLIWAVVTGPLLLGLLLEMYRFRKRQLRIRKARGRTPPYSWPVQAELDSEIYDPEDLAVVSRLLHRRAKSEVERLDIPGTILASLSALGFPTFKYRRDSRLPEYLFLIDRAGFRRVRMMVAPH